MELVLVLKNGKWERNITIEFITERIGDPNRILGRWVCRTPEWINLIAWQTSGKYGGGIDDRPYVQGFSSSVYTFNDDQSIAFILYGAPWYESGREFNGPWVITGARNDIYNVHRTGMVFEWFRRDSTNRLWRPQI